jgi:hypothetical protein
MTQSWSELIHGLQWSRQPAASGQYEYWYQIENEGDVPSEIRENAAAMDELRMAEGAVGKTAADWDAWAYRATFWTPDLYAPDPVEEPATAEEPAAEEVAPDPNDENDDDADEDGAEDDDHGNEAGRGEDLLILDLGPPVIDGLIGARRLADPTVQSVRRPQYTTAGAYSWPVSMQVVESQPVLSWVIQKVVRVDDDEEVSTMWEAFPVAADQSIAAAKDIYQDDHKANSGAITVTGLMKHFVFTGGAWPPGMSKGGHPDADREQLSASQQPEFWGDDDGTPHDLTFTWSIFRPVELTTVPDGGDPEKKTAGTIQTG